MEKYKFDAARIRLSLFTRIKPNIAAQSKLKWEMRLINLLVERLDLREIRGLRSL